MLIASMVSMIGPLNNAAAADGMSWIFIGTDAAGRHYVWKLIFFYATRSFQARPIRDAEALRYATRMAEADLFRSDHDRPEFVPDLKKTTADNLAALLNETEMAKAMGGALTYRG